MVVKSKEKIVDLVDHEELLLLFRQYVDQCIEEHTSANKSRPLSFDEWYVRVFEPNRNDETVVVDFELAEVTAVDGFLSGSRRPESYKVRIPIDMIAESGAIFDIVGVRRLAKKFSQMMNRRLPSVWYHGKQVYSWSWD